jgi:CheY-like chemotaxis protein
MTSQPLIVLVEDDKGHAILTERWLRREGITYEFTHLSEGQDAVDFLLRQGAYQGTTLPEKVVVLLDLNLPLLTGLQVLEQIADDEQANAVPRIILTTSDEPSDIARCRQLGFDGYFVKPPSYEAIARLIETLLQQER